jgi:hypothetical protein
VDELIKTVSEKAGISVDQAQTAVNTVLDFLKAKFPGVGDQVQGLISGGGGGGGTGDVLDAARKKFGF